MSKRLKNGLKSILKNLIKKIVEVNSVRLSLNFRLFCRNFRGEDIKNSMNLSKFHLQFKERTHFRVFFLVIPIFHDSGYGVNSYVVMI